jgi:hypothetical protein
MGIGYFAIGLLEYLMDLNNHFMGIGYFAIGLLEYLMDLKIFFIDC